jgi:hypothetical protein
MDASGKILSNERILTTVEDLDRFLDRFEDASFVLESTGIWEFIYEAIERRGFEVVLAHPLKVRAIAEAKVKTDKIDARTLAHLLRADLVPRSYIPSKDIRDLRQLVRQRAYLVQKSTGFKNRIHAELLRRGVRRPKEFATPFSSKSVAWMRSLAIPTVNADLECLAALQAQVEQLNEQAAPGVQPEEGGAVDRHDTGHRVLWSVAHLGRDRRRAPVPGRGASVLLRRADADRQPVGVELALRRREQGRLEVPALGPDGERSHSRRLLSRLATLSLPRESRSSPW